MLGLNLENQMRCPAADNPQSVLPASKPVKTVANRWQRVDDLYRQDGCDILDSENGILQRHGTSPDLRCQKD